MPTPAVLLLIATLAPLASFTLLVFIGKRLGNPLAGYIATFSVALGFVLSGIAMMSWLSGGSFVDPTRNVAVEWGAGKNPINIPIHWIPAGEWTLQDPSSRGLLDVGIYVDSLTVVMFTMITLVATLVHIFSIGYMRDDPRFPRFFTHLGLFCFSMLGLIIGGTLLHLFVFWELVGLCSYLLIGFWYERKSATNAAIKAFVVNRIGDAGFLVGFGLVFYHLGNVTFPGLWTSLNGAGQGGPVTLPDGAVMSAGVMTTIGICLFLGAVGKSAQFPLHVWLPDAMEGPTPVSALIHAATMVAAGVYLVARIFPVLTPDAKLFIAIIGCVTLVMAALIALAQSDIKKVLAYSTISQLGYMILAMGVGSWVGGLFHLMTHAFFKALLFLAAGSVIHAARHEQEMSQYGGLIRKIPITAFTFLIGVLAIAGTPLTSAYYSKDMILAHAAAFGLLAEASGKSSFYKLFFFLPAVVALLTAVYMMRCWMLTFWGRERNPSLHKNAHESASMWTPLVVLAGFSVVAGYDWFPVRRMLEYSVRETQNYCEVSVAHVDANAKFAGFDTVWPSEDSGSLRANSLVDAEAQPEETIELLSASQRLHDRGTYLAHAWTLRGFLFAVGLALAAGVYARGYAVSDRLMKFAPARWVHTWLYRRMYFDDLYWSVFVGATTGASRLATLFDRYVLDGIVHGFAAVVRGASRVARLHDDHMVDGVIKGIARLSREAGAVVRLPQSGRVRLYVTLLMAAVTVGLAGAVAFSLAT